MELMYSRDTGRYVRMMLPLISVPLIKKNDASAPSQLVGVLCCMAIPHKSAREFDERFFVRKRCKTAGILCVFQGFTNEFLAEKISGPPAKPNEVGLVG